MSTAKHRTHASSGSMVLYLIAILVVLGVVSIAATGFFSSSEVSTARTNCTALAGYVAESGVRYAESELRAAPDLATLTATAATLNGTTYTIDGAGTFDLTVGAPAAGATSGKYECTVSCTSTVCSDTPTSDTINAGPVVSNIATGPTPDPDPNGEISLDDGVESFNPVTGGDHPDNAIQTDPENDSVSVGNGVKRSYGCFWYHGDQGGCADGVCPFENGLRAYVRAKLSPDAEADGFVFAIISADQNEVNDCGGQADRDELLGYSGPGNNLTWVKGGLQPPKIGLEFDIYPNPGDGNHDPSRPNSRKDDPASRDHTAWVFWGSHDWIGDTYDDNQHGSPKWGETGPVPYGADDPTNPENISASGYGADGYYYDEEHGGDWLRGYNTENEDKKFRIRIEMDRPHAANADGNYCYVLRAWIVRDEVEVPASFFDLSQDYYDPRDESTWPQVEHAVVLNRARHRALNNVIVGITFATGNATSTITFDKLDVTFKHTAASCAEPTKPADYMMAFPFSRGQGNTFDYMASPTSRQTSSISGAYWLKGKSCPECSGLYFDGDHGPALVWGYGIANAFRTTGTVSTWINIKNYNNLAGILFRGNDFNTEALALQFTQDRYRTDGSTVRINEDRKQGPNYFIDHGDKKPALCFTDTAGKTYCIDSKYEMETERWYHIAATWDTNADIMQFYVNGEKTATFTPNVAPNNWDMQAMYSPWDIPIVVGTQTLSRGTYSFNGMVDEMYLYSRVLTDEEIVALYNDGLQAPRPEE